MAHFRISRQAVHYWRKKGVPARHRTTLAMLGAVAGYDMPELRDCAGARDSLERTGEAA